MSAGGHLVGWKMMAKWLKYKTKSMEYADNIKVDVKQRVKFNFLRLHFRGELR